MATNKRKEAAALFELIDKSTLKVPKNAGALKIPNWWSSKTNPPPAPLPAAPSTSPRQTSTAPAARATPLSPGASAPAKAVNGHHETHGAPLPATGRQPEAAPPPPAPAPTAQARLFEPPPSDVETDVSPSIRPPARTPVSAPTSRAPVAAPAPATPAPAPPAPVAAPIRAPLIAASPPPPPAPEAPAPLKPTLPIAEEVPPPEPEPTIERAPLKPPTMGAAPTSAMSRRWPPPGRNALGHLPPLSSIPPMILVAGGAIVVLLLIIIIAVIFHHPKAATPLPQSTVEAPLTGPGSTLGPTPTPAQPGPLLPGNTPPQDVQRPPPVAPAPGPKIYEPGTYPFSPDSLYVVIASSTSETVSRRNAKFFADHNVDVAIEKAGEQFKLIATKPFPSNAAAEPYVQKIRDLGKLHPDYRPNRKVFSDAAVRRITMSPR